MNNKPQIHVFGEVLFDHFHDGSRVLGGAPFNVAWHLQAFGQAPHFISRLGDDQAGQEITAIMDTWGMNLEALQFDPEHSTGSVKVSIHDGEPHYEIVEDSAYDFIAEELLVNNQTQGILYHGSLAIRNLASLSALQAVKRRHQGKIFIDVNLRPPWWSRETLLPLINDADWVKLNENELAELCPETAELETTMQWFSTQFELELLIVTRGANGAIALERDGHFIAVKPQTSTEVVDTVGAGDAFAALLLLGLHNHWPIKSALERAQLFASAIVGQRGATVFDQNFYRLFREKWL